MAREAGLEEALVGILGELIARPSPYPPGDTRAICAYAADRLAQAGYATETIVADPEGAPGIVNIVARMGSGRPSLVFNAHADTVAAGAADAWGSDPFVPQVRGGHVFGLGAGNAKGSMAVQIWLAEELARRGGPKAGEVVFTFVGDEERLGPLGLRHLREAGIVRPDWLVLGAQTENQLITEERGVMWARITTHGRAAHAGNPAAGDNAILRMMRLLKRIEAELVPALRHRRAGDKQSTLNIGLIRGGSNTNVVPARCLVEIDRRLLPDEKVEMAMAELTGIVLGGGEPEGSVRIERLAGTNGFSGPKDGPCVAAFAQAIAAETGEPPRFLNATGVSDGRWFADDGIEILNFGPGSGAQGHAANESVPIDQMAAAARIQLAVVERLLGLAGP